jgi:hypothetical protein
VNKWAKNLGYTVKVYSNGYKYSKDGVTNKTRNLARLIRNIEEEISPVGNQQKINQMIGSWDAFMAYEVD